MRQGISVNVMRVAALWWPAVGLVWGGCGRYPAPGFHRSSDIAQGAVLRSVVEDTRGGCRGPFELRYGGDRNTVIETDPPIHERDWLISRCGTQDTWVVDCSYHEGKGAICSAHGAYPPDDTSSSIDRMLAVAIGTAQRIRCESELPVMEARSHIEPNTSYSIRLAEPLAPIAMSAHMVIVKCEKERPLDIVCEKGPPLTCRDAAIPAEPPKD